VPFMELSKSAFPTSLTPIINFPLNPHPLMNQTPKDAAPKIVLATYSLPHPPSLNS